MHGRVLLAAVAAAIACAGPARAGPSNRTRVYDVIVPPDTVRVRITSRVASPSVVRAECVLPRPVGVVWSVLSDYDDLARLIPAVDTSRVLDRTGRFVRLYQHGRVGVAFLRRGFRVVFRVEELPRTYIGFRAIDGDFRVFDGSWQVAPRNGGTWVAHRVEVEPRFWAPAWIRQRVAEHLMRQTIRAVVEQCLVVGARSSAPSDSTSPRARRSRP